MNRAIILVLDSLGIGASDDAYMYGDEGSDTLGHIAEYCAAGKADNNIRAGALDIPNLQRLGLVAAANSSRGKEMPVLQNITPQSAYGFASEVSVGKTLRADIGRCVGCLYLFSGAYSLIQMNASHLN